MELMTPHLSRVWLCLFFLALLYATVLVQTTLHYIRGDKEETRLTQPPAATATSTPVASATPWPSPAASGTPLPGAIASSPTPDALLLPSSVAPGKLIIPVAGVRASDLRNNYNDARSEGRIHDAIDIMAPRGTAVLAASDGEITRLFYSDRGGVTLYQLSPDKKAVFYYAHMERYADGLAAGHYARQGQVIAYVGDTGNAGAGNYHLHFSIWLITDPKRYWNGVNINPYPILISTGEAKAAHLPRRLRTRHEHAGKPASRARGLRRDAGSTDPG